MASNGLYPDDRAESRKDVLELYDSYARLHPRKPEWAVNFRGRFVTPRPDNLRRRMLLRVIRRVLHATPEQLSSDTFQERIAGFLMLTQSGRRIRGEIAGRSFSLRKKSKRSGQYKAVLRIAVDEMDSVDLHGHDCPWLEIHVESRRTLQTVKGRVQFVGNEGPSVISDIDDTIKSSEVNDRRQLLANTFFHPFREISGMAELYRKWANQSTVFHYVSSSPWQLYQPLASFVSTSGFPDGSFHLRSIALRDPSILQLVVGRRRSKKQAICSILRSFPARRFVLVGDMGEKDPEIYGAMARRYPGQVAQICIRRLKDVDSQEGRWYRAFRDVPRDHWRIFEHPEELEDLQPEAGIGWDARRLLAAPSPLGSCSF